MIIYSELMKDDWDSFKLSAPWEELKATLKELRENLVKEVVYATTDSEVERDRGRIMMIDEILALDIETYKGKEN